MLANQVRRFGEVLVDRHVLSRDDFEAALEESTQTGTPLPAVLRTRGLVFEKDLTAAIAHTVGLRFVDFQETPIHPDAATMIPASYARKYQAIGVGFEDRKLVVALAEPDDDAALSAVGGITGYEIIPAAADRHEVEHASAMVFGAPEGAAAGEAGEAAAGAEELMITDLLDRVLALGGSDLHLTSGTHPVTRVHGDLRHLTEFPELNGSQIRQMVFSILTQKQREKFEQELELDTSYSMPGRSRFRVNVFLQRDSVGCVMRVIPYEIVPFDQLGIPDVVRGFAHLPRGLVLITGPTGSGKSTTLASLIDIVNSEKPVHIMTIEDPIEFLHQHKTAIVNQREVGEDTHSFSNALKHVLRQDPDVILVGEMRDLETISTALTAAETGHLVFATLHTQDAPQSIDRVIDVFPAHQQQQIRVQLAGSLQGIVTQQLLPTADGMGRACAGEVLVATAAIRNLIREAKVHQIPSIMQAGGRYGMVTMDQSLAKLVRQGKITMDLAVERCAHESELRRLVQAL
jgi:twitching motility protein PilT